MDVLTVGKPQLVHAAGSRPGAVEEADRARVLRHRDVEQLEPRRLQPLLRRLIGDRQDVADRFQRVRAHMGLRQIGACDDLWGARIADIDGGEVLWCALMGEPQDAAAVLGYLDRHALADSAKPVELVMRELPKIPNRRICHLSCLLLICGDRITLCRQPSRAALASSRRGDAALYRRTVIWLL